MNIGFTGTRDGMTPFQRDQLEKVLSALKADFSFFHHGGCIGADEEAHRIANGCGFRCVIWPPTNKSKYVEVLEESAFQVMDPAPYLDRNQFIVDAASLFVAAPKEDDEVLRSGTWATIRRARASHLPIIMLTR